MPASRRDFLRAATITAAGAGLGLTSGHRAVAVPVPPSARPRKLLILGGTGFIGPHMVSYAVERGHEVTILTRGRSGAPVPGVEHLIADREGDLGVLRRRRWDAVLDNNARDYRWVTRSTRAGRQSCGRG